MTSTTLLKTRRIVLFAAAAVSLSATSIVQVQAQDKTPNKIVLSSQPNEAGFPMWLANKLGYYGERGLEVKIQYFPNGGAALASGAAGDWQAGWTGSPPASRHRKISGRV